MLAPVIQITPLTQIRRHRELPIPGNIVVRQGQKVEARDVIAEAHLEPEHILLNIARSLHVSPEKADDLIQRAAGEFVTQDDLIAGPTGFPKRVVRAPRSGRIVVAGDGLVLLQVNTAPYELKAGMPGTITDLIPDRGAVIETTGALVQGVWGNGRSEFGMMQVKLDGSDDQLQRDMLDVSLRGAIVLGGYCDDPQVFKKAAEIPLRGLILVSMSAAMIPHAQKAAFPIIVLEGFGFHPLNAIGYNVLATNNGREISLNAEQIDHYKGIRPEIVIPLDAGHTPNDASLVVEDFAPGQQVRVIKAPYAGKTGNITALSQEPLKFPSGIRAPGAYITLSDNEDVKVPLANLEKVI